MATISKAVVRSIRQYGDDVREYILKLEKNHYFDAGTFVQLTLDTEIGNRWPESRNFSVASAPNNNGELRLVIRKVGAYTTRIFNELTIGKACTLKYSFGDFLIPSFDKKSKIVCIAGGTGVAPFISFAESLCQTNEQHRLILFYSAKNLKELICLDELKKLIPADQFFIHTTREVVDGIIPTRISTEKVVEQASDNLNAHFYICGGEEFTNRFKQELTAKGISNIYTDEW